MNQVGASDLVEPDRDRGGRRGGEHRVPWRQTARTIAKAAPMAAFNPMRPSLAITCWENCSASRRIYLPPQNAEFLWLLQLCYSIEVAN